jgi:hypothetical protein
MSKEDELEAAAGKMLEELARRFADLGSDARWRVARAFIHRAVHDAATNKVDFCVLATYLAEMIPHAHGLMHGADPASPKHREVVH